MRLFKKELLAALGLLGFLAPAVVFAQGLDQLTNLVRSIGNIITILIPILLALAVVAFFWGLVQFIFSGGEPEKRKEGRKLMIFAVIAIAVMVLLYGIILFIGTNLGLGSGGGQLTPPSVQNKY